MPPLRLPGSSTDEPAFTLPREATTSRRCGEACLYGLVSKGLDVPDLESAGNLFRICEYLIEAQTSYYMKNASLGTP